MVCGRMCRNNMDVRCCCEPNCPSKNTTKQFNQCPQKIHTLYFTLYNDYTTYKYLEERENKATQRHHAKIKHELLKTDVYQVMNNICGFVGNETYLSIDDIRIAVNMLSPLIKISTNECQAIIDLGIQERQDWY